MTHEIAENIIKHGIPTEKLCSCGRIYKAYLRRCPIDFSQKKTRTIRKMEELKRDEILSYNSKKLGRISF